jgi:hypothetical protein
MDKCDFAPLSTPTAHDGQETEEISILDRHGNPIATLRTEPIRYIKDIWQTRDMGDHVYRLQLHPSQFEAVWEAFRGICDCHRCQDTEGVRDLSKDIA